LSGLPPALFSLLGLFKGFHKLVVQLRTFLEVIPSGLQTLGVGLERTLGSGFDLRSPIGKGLKGCVQKSVTYYYGRRSDPKEPEKLFLSSLLNHYILTRTPSKP
jgi:hypothetical protein